MLHGCIISFNVLAVLCIALFFQPGTLICQSLSTKSSRHTVHQLQKEGWVCMNAISMEQMLNNSLIKQQELGPDAIPIYLTGEGSAVANTKDQAMSQALEIARIQLAGLLETPMHAAIQASLSSLSINNEVKKSIVNIIQSSYNTFVSRLPYFEPEWLIFREISGKKTEAELRIFYSRKESVNQWNTLLMQELKDKLQLPDDQIQRIVNRE